MTRVLTLALLTGVLAIPLCSTGSVPSSSLTVRNPLPAAIGTTTPSRISKLRRRQPGRRCKSLPRPAAVRTSREEPTVVILYGGRPWSWM
ncbi:MAG TPA: hypothetical protein VI424_06285 [Terriglobales bacterium]|jgi:hypothetical protein